MGNSNRSCPFLKQTEIQIGICGESLMKDKNDLKLLDVMCKWYIWAVVGLVIGNWLSDTLGSPIGLALGSLIGWYIQKNYNKKDNG